MPDSRVRKARTAPSASSEVIEIVSFSDHRGASPGAARRGALPCSRHGRSRPAARRGRLRRHALTSCQPTGRLDSMSSASADTRVRILETTVRMLEESGGRGVRMGDIAGEAGVSRQAVYLHFASRADLLVAATRYLDEKLDVEGRIARSGHSKNAARPARCRFPAVVCRRITVPNSPARSALPVLAAEFAAPISALSRFGELFSTTRYCSSASA